MSCTLKHSTSLFFSIHLLQGIHHRITSPSYKATTTPKKATNPTIPPTTPVGRAAAPVAGFLAPPVAFAPLAAVPVVSVFPPVPEPPDAPLVQRAIWLTEVA